MKTSERLLQQIDVTKLPLWENGGIVRRQRPALVLTGHQLAMRLQDAINQRRRLEVCIQAMSEALDSGESPDERARRIAVEDADPETHARGGGWLLSEDFAGSCSDKPTGFYRHMKDVTGRIVRPRDTDRARLLGEGWPEHPGRAFHWGDYFDHADGWKQALHMVRVAQAEALTEKYKEA